MTSSRRSTTSRSTRGKRTTQVSGTGVLLLLLLLGIGLLIDRFDLLEEATPTPFSTDAEGGTIGIFVEPDDGRAPILSELDAARRTITLQVYLLSDAEIKQALIRAAGRGVEVRVLLEEHPFGGAGLNPKSFDELAAGGVAVRWSNPVFTFSHVKTFVVDGEVAIVTNANMTTSAFTRNREFGAITTRPAEVAQAMAIFEADWNRSAEPGTGPLVVSPTDSRPRLLGLIEGASHSIDIYAEVVRDREIVEALLAALERDVSVRLIMSADEGEEDRGDDARVELADAGAAVRFLNSPYIHAKIVLVDRVRAYLGSQNFTATSLDQNREIGVIFDEPAGIARIAQTFATDFSKAEPM
jgi:cardiolipin synthase A/B